MRSLLLSLFLVVISPLYGQEDESPFAPDSIQELLRPKLDSILEEANHIYQLDQVAWHSSDIFMALDREITSKAGGYVIMESRRNITCIWYDREVQHSLCELVFRKSDVSTPKDTKIEERELTNDELEFIDAKSQVLEAAFKAYGDQITIAEGVQFNPVFFEIEDGWRLYLMPGYSGDYIIPIGNDYMIELNEDLLPTRFIKYHTRLLPQTIEPQEGKEIESLMHSHIKTSPLISPVEICIFRAYTAVYNLDISLHVYSTYYGVIFMYNDSLDRILILN